jgi:subtilisin family serine protease
MRKILIIIKLCFVFLASTFHLQSQNVYSDSWDGTMYVMFKTSMPDIPSNGKNVNISDLKILSEIQSEFGIVAVEKINYFSTSDDMKRIYRIYFTEVAKIDWLIKELLLNEDVKYAERSPIIECFSNVNDADYLAFAKNRWHLDKINAEQAWLVPRQTNTIKIAVVDKAMDMDHPDLVAQWDVLYDIFAGDNNTNPPASVANNHASWSHGTHVAGLAGATTNNGIGIASIAYNVRLMGIKITNDVEMNIGGVTAPSGSMISAYEGVTWAAENGADIINMSWGGRYYSQIKQEIMNYAAITKGCFLAAGAGNIGTSDKYYPAALNNVVAVAATNGDDKLNTQGMPPVYVSAGSNFGDWIDVCAPGFGMTNSSDQNTVYSTSYDNSYMVIGGTSMATPIVSGLAALIKSINPQLSAYSIINIIKATCVDISNLQIDNDRKNGVGSGRIDAAAAANMAYQTLTQIIPDFIANKVYIEAGESINFTNLSCGNNITSYSWTFQGASNPSSNAQNPQNIVYPTSGIYNVTLQISNGTTNETITKNEFIVVRDANSKWIEQASGFSTTHRSIKDIAIVNEQIAWASAFDGVNEFLLTEFTRTNNAGYSWHSGAVQGSNIPNTYRISNISPVSFDKAFVAMHSLLTTPVANQSGGIFVTIDGGTTWTRQETALFNDSKSVPTAVHFFDELNGWCMGNPISNVYEMYTTTDAGTTWTKVPNANIPAASGGEKPIIGQYDSYGDYLWFGTNKGRVYKSINKGLNWTVVQTSLSKISTITFANENIGIVQNIAYNMLYTNIVTFQNLITVNGGQTWTTFTPGNGIRKTAIDFVPGNPNILISVGTDGTANETQGSAISTDKGLTWTAIDNGVIYSSLKMYNDEVGFAGGLNRSPISGGVYKWNPNDNPTLIPDFSQNDKNRFSVFPNPTSSKIQLIGYCQENATINILDLTGKHVYKQAIEKVGFIDETINLQFLPKGMYILSISMQNEINYEKIIID